jgi:hypothetical protein
LGNYPRCGFGRDVARENEVLEVAYSIKVEERGSVGIVSTGGLLIECEGSWEVGAVAKRAGCCAFADAAESFD